MTCKDCKYWGDANPGPQDDIDIRYCNHSMVCKPSYGSGASLTMTSSGVLTCDEGGMTGELMTGPDFGCVHFKSK